MQSRTSIGPPRGVSPAGVDAPRSALALLLALALALGLPPAPCQAGSTFDPNLELSVGAQYGTLDQWRLSVDGTGATTNVKTSTTRLFEAAHLSTDARFLNDLRDDLVLDVRAAFRFDGYSPEVLADERYGLLTGQGTAKLGWAQSDATLWVLKLTLGLDQEETWPRLSATTLGGELALDRTIGTHTFLTLRGGGRDVALDEDPLWDHQDLYLRADYVNVAPEKYDIDPLPAHPRSYLPDPESYFANQERLGLRSSRDLMRRRGKAALLLAHVAPVAPPPPEDLKMSIKLRESTFASTFGVTSRSFAEMDQELLRTDAGASARWDLGDAVALTASESVAWEDYRREDTTLLLMDHLENLFRLQLTHSRRRQHLNLEARVQSFLFDPHDEWDYHVGRVSASWDYYDGRRYSYGLQTYYQRELPKERRVDNEYTREYRVLGHFRVHFTPAKTLQLTVGREREAVNGTHTEFDSSYIQDTVDLRYRHRFRPDLSWEAGYLSERERHEIFYVNNRDEGLGYLNLVAHM